MRVLSVYIHIPFCVQKCRYCDFLSAPSNEETRNLYLCALKREIAKEAENYREYEIATIFFGGGTPSILEASQIADILVTINKNYNLKNEVEISLEMNPGTASYEKLVGLREAGINRLSIGLQSTWNEELKMLGRIHTYEEFLQIYNDARKAGFTNINVDLMSGLPGQTCDKWKMTLDRIMKLNPEHISAYSLIIEEGTYLYDHLDSIAILPSEDDDRQMYQDTKKVLAEHGYERYEISNYSKPGMESKHNCAYWIRDNYVGFGLGASSMVENRRWKNTDDLKQYVDIVFSFEKEEVEELSIEDCMAEYMFLGLRMMKGISVAKFASLFGKNLYDVYGDTIKKWSDLGYLICDADVIKLSDEGIDISNQIFADFI